MKYHRDAARGGSCCGCGGVIRAGDRIHVTRGRYRTWTRCVACRPEAGVGTGPTLAAAVANTSGPVEGVHEGTGPDAVRAAEVIMADAPAHLRAALESIRTSVSTLVYLGCPREGVAAAILLGREDGARDYRATMAGDVAGQVASVIDTIGESVPMPDVQPACDAFDQIDRTCPDAAAYAADTSGDDARAGAFDLDAFADVLSIPTTPEAADATCVDIAPIVVEPTVMDRMVARPQVSAARYRRSGARVVPVATDGEADGGAPWIA